MFVTIALTSLTLYLSVYDTTSVDSFNSLQTWYNEMGTYCTNPDAVTMLVGNKTDRKVCILSGLYWCRISQVPLCFICSVAG